MKAGALQTGHDTWWHRRDPRLKWALFLLLIVLIYLAPSWAWMAGMVVIGVALVLTSRAPLKVVGLLLVIQVPNIVGLIVFPMLSGEFAVDSEFFLGLRLALGWIAAILIGVSLMSTMEIDEMVAGLRGLRVPRQVAFTVGYAFLLVYLSLGDIARVSESMKLKGMVFSARHPFKLLRATLAMFVPMLITVARRGGAMMAALEMRGVLERQRSEPVRRHTFDLADAATAAIAIAIVGHAGAVRAEAMEPVHPLLGNQAEASDTEGKGSSAE